ncbi:MAG: hypothetical protein FJ100_13830 [Deltaproteobacteria bacterium]|nr:hypothetical protein [Deltaproteobacteria bacterium]
MRILEDNSDKSLTAVSIFLTRAEAAELRDALVALLDGNGEGHEHVSSADFQKEITVAIYDDNNWIQFNERVQRLIVDDE